MKRSVPIIAETPEKKCGVALAYLPPPAEESGIFHGIFFNEVAKCCSLQLFKYKSKYNLSHLSL